MRARSEAGFVLISVAVAVAIIALAVGALIGARTLSVRGEARLAQDLSDEIALRDAAALVGFVALTQSPTELGRRIPAGERSINLRDRERAVDWLFDGRVYGVRSSLQAFNDLGIAVQDEAGLVNLRLVDAGVIQRWFQNEGVRRTEAQRLASQMQAVLNDGPQSNGDGGGLLPISVAALLQRVGARDVLAPEVLAQTERQFSTSVYPTSFNPNTASAAALKAVHDLEDDESALLVSQREERILLDLSDLADVIGRRPLDSVGRTVAFAPVALRIRAQRARGAARGNSLGVGEVRFLQAVNDPKRPFYVVRRTARFSLTVARSTQGSVNVDRTVSVDAILSSSPQR